MRHEIKTRKSSDAGCEPVSYTHLDVYKRQALSLCLARDQGQAELGRLAAFFTVVGDTLALFALQPDLRPPDQGAK